jgi:predicted transcriptional regulator
MMEKNPIDKIKVAENPGLMEYAHTAGGAVIRPEDVGKVKGKAQLAMRQQTNEQLSKIYKQMELLAQQAKEIKNRIDISERIYDAAIGFEPIINHVYYLYEKKDGSDILSMIAPSEWGRSFPFNQFLARVFLLADHTWKVEFFQEDDRSDTIDLNDLD